MPETSTAKSSGQIVTGETVRHFFRDIQDHTVVAILALQPSIAELEEAALRAGGADEAFIGLRPERSVVARIVELIEADNAVVDEEPTHGA